MINELLSQLNEQQRKAVKYIQGPMIVFAGAGTGKTRVITYRIAYLLSLGVNPDNILAVTFTNKAAEEMKKRVVSLVPQKGENVWISTFHSFCARLLYTEAKNFGLKENFVIYDETDSIKVIKECLKELSVAQPKISVYEIYEHICRAKDNLIDPESYKINTLVSHQPYRELVAQVYSKYQQKLEKYNALDFGDLIMKTVELLKNPEFSSIKDKYAERFHYIHVDEFQDVNYAQVVLLKILSSKHKNICVVGDDDQAIYSWRGSDVRFILNFKHNFFKQKINVKEFVLEQNYRSPQSILNVATTLINNNKYRVNKNLYSAIKGELKTDVKLLSCKNERDQAITVANEILSLSKKKEFNNSTIAVLYRTNAQSYMFEEVFREKKIPYKIVGAIAFYERQEIKDIIAYLRILVNPEDTVSLKRIINVPPRGIGETTLLYLDTLAKEKDVSLWKQLTEIDTTDLSLKAKNAVWKFLTLYDLLKRYKDSMYPSEFIKFLIEKIGYISYIEETNKFENKVEKIQNLEELVSTAKYYESEYNISTVEEFLNKISLLTSVDTEIHKNGSNKISQEVVLMTLHSAKGLEFDVVFITGLEEGILPIYWAVENKNKLWYYYLKETPQVEDYLNEKVPPSDMYTIEEERRLCYVGITRAKKRVYLTYALKRSLWGVEYESIPSRFIEEILDVYNSDLLLQNDVKEINNEVENVERVDYLRVGEYVIHEKFGIGKVVDILPEYENDKVVVLFKDGKQRKFCLPFAKLKKLKVNKSDEENNKR